MANLNSQTVFQQEVMHLPTPERKGKPVQLTISYRLSGDGRRLADDFCADLEPGQPFDIQSPQIPGFYTLDGSVSGTMPENGNSLGLTVFYEPCYDGEPDYEPTLWERFQQTRWFKPAVLAVVITLCVISARLPWSPENLLRHYLFPTETVAEEVSDTELDKTQEYILTVRYVFEGGSNALPSYVARCVEGSAYEITSPVIEGYVPSKTVVTGYMPDADCTDTVVYYSATSVLSDPAYIGNASTGGGMNVEDIPEYVPKGDFQPKAPYIDEESYKVDPGDTSLKSDDPEHNPSVLTDDTPRS